VRWSGKSGGEVIAECLPHAHVFKAFNTIGVEHMAKPEGIQMMFAGPDNDAKKVAEAIVAAVGFQPLYVGPIRYSRNLEAMAELWIHCSIPPLPAANWGGNWSWAKVDH
jgi:8-hydroxy-5-deazaflavin:NADPH oxidoreductase